MKGSESNVMGLPLDETLDLLSKAAKEVAAQLEMTTGAVYVAKTRVLQRLKQCIHDIDDGSSWLELKPNGKGLGAGP